MIKTLWAVTVLLAGLAMWNVVALAQSPAAPDPASTALNILIDAIVHKNYPVLVSAAVVLLVSGLKILVQKDTAPWLHTKIAGWAMNFLGSVAGVLGATTMLGKPFTAGIITMIIGAAGGVTIFVELWQDIQEGLAKKAPPVALLLLCLASPAKAQDFSQGITLIPYTEIDIPAKNSAPTTQELAAGAGYQVSVGFFPTQISGKYFDLLSIGLLAFPSFSNQSALSLDLAAVLGTIQNAINIGVGLRAISYTGGKLGGAAAGEFAPFIVFSVSRNLSVLEKLLPGMTEGQKLERGNMF